MLAFSRVQLQTACSALQHLLFGKPKVVVPGSGINQKPVIKKFAS